jgi:membrane-associated phospholipid phosphatase
MSPLELATAGALFLSIVQANGDVEEAKDLSDQLRTISEVLYLTTAPDWETRLRQWVMVENSREIVGRIKHSTHIERPDGSDRHSFPSGHTSTTAIQAAFASQNKNLGSIPQMLTFTTGWARVEAERHRPIDVIAGAAVGWSLAQVKIETSNGWITPVLTDDTIGLVWITGLE